MGIEIVRYSSEIGVEINDNICIGMGFNGYSFLPNPKIV